jgi:hypothetical protein
MRHERIPMHQLKLDRFGSSGSNQDLKQTITHNVFFDRYL